MKIKGKVIFYFVIHKNWKGWKNQNKNLIMAFDLTRIENEVNFMLNKIYFCFFYVF